jgi:hypothetical protein
MLEGTGKPSFTPIHDALGSRDRDERSQRLLGQATDDGGWRLYAHDPSRPSGIGGDALSRRLEKGSELVFQGMETDHGRAMATRVLWKVTEKVHGLRGTFEEGMTRGDLILFREELQSQELQLKELRDRIPNDTAEVIKDDLAGNWTSAAKEQFYPIQRPGSATEVEPSSRDGVKEGYYPVRWPGDAEVVGLRPTMYAFKEGPGAAEVVGPRPLYEVREEYSSIQWPDSDARVALRDVIHADHIQRSTMHFDERAGKLTLTQGEQGDSEANKKALAKFIDKHFGVKPGQSAFQNIANNILSYLPRGVGASMTDKMRDVVGNAAATDGNAVQSWFTLSAAEGGNVGVAGHTTIRSVNFSSYAFVRQEGFEILGEHLRVDPTAFDAKANLVSVDRFDTVNVAV